MFMADIKHFMTIFAPAATVYKAITGQNGLALWWAKDTIARPETGFVNEFRFDTGYHNKMKIIRLEENALVQWECIGGGKE
jgi:uncharacterized protein YndB with AHSA1/START domain